MMKFDHIGIAVRNIQKEVERFEKLGYSAGQEFVDDIQGVSGIFLEGDGPRLELVQTLNGRHTLEPWLKQFDFRPYHFAYRVDDANNLVHQLGAVGSKLAKSKEPAVAFPGMEICFVTFSSVFLIEIISSIN